MDLRVVAIQSIPNSKQNPTTTKDGSKKKPPASFAEVLKDAMKQ